jgi:hypothetical protein
MKLIERAADKAADNPNWLVRQFSRVCDVDKAARRWKPVYAFTAAVWLVRAGLVIGTSIDEYMDYSRFTAETPKASFVENMRAHPEFVSKFVLYEGIWVGLSILRWGGFAYGTLGYMRHRQMQKSLQPKQPG